MRKPAEPRAVVETRKLSTLKPNPLNPRAPDENDPSLAELAQSIRTTGLLQPIVVVPSGLIVAGHRRAIACRKAGLTEVAVLVREMDEGEQLEAMLAENAQRKSLNPLELAKGCLALMERQKTLEEIASATGIGVQTARKHLLILKLHPDLHAKVASYEMPMGYVPHLAELKDQQKQLEIARRALKENWLVYEVSAAVADLKRPDPPPAAAPTRRSPAASSAHSIALATTPRAAPPMEKSADGWSRKAPSEGRILDLLTEASRILDSKHSLIRDASVKGAIERFAKIVREAQGARG